MITDMNLKMQEKELIKKLTNQNEILKDSKIYESKKYNRTIFNAVILGLKLNTRVAFYISGLGNKNKY